MSLPSVMMARCPLCNRELPVEKSQFPNLYTLPPHTKKKYGELMCTWKVPVTEKRVYLSTTTKGA